jgi:DNA-binding response OmpR family regulator
MAKILLVEDDQFLREINADILKSEGYDVITAADGIEALSKIKSDSWDLILMDVVLPKMGGFEIVEQVKKEKQITTPIIFLTNSEYIEDKKRATDLGGIYAIKSSLTPPDLVALIKKHLPLLA